MRAKGVSLCFRKYRWLPAVLTILAILGAAAESGQALAECCVNFAMMEMCMEPGDVAKLVDPAAVRRMFTNKTPVLQKAVLKDRMPVRHPRAAALADRWNKIVSEVLNRPGKRDEFYRSVLEDMELHGLMKVRIDCPPIVRVSGLPKSPRLAFTMAGLRETLRTAGEAEPPQADLEGQLEVMNSALEAQGIGEQIGRSFNMIPLIAEFVYQLRLNYRDLTKQVIVFRDEPGENSPEVDMLGTLYVPKSFFDGYDATDQELILVHEAMHLALPAATWLMQLVMNRLDATGPMTEILGTSDFKKRLGKTKMDTEYEQDVRVLLFFKSKPDMRRRYQTLMRRLEPGSQRASIIAFLDQHISAGRWPRPMIHLRLRDLRPLLQAGAYYESLPDGPEKAAAMIRMMELLLASLPEQERNFYRPLYQLIFKQQSQHPEKLVLSSGLRPSPSETEILKDGLGMIFKELSDRWER